MSRSFVPRLSLFSAGWGVVLIALASGCTAEEEQSATTTTTTMPPPERQLVEPACAGPIHSDPLRIVDISASSRTTCVLDNAGSAYCWGDNTVGQGLVQHAESELRSPVRSPYAHCMTDLILGGWFGCATVFPDRAVCWGSNKFGEVSALDSGAFGARPRVPMLLDSVVQIGGAAAVTADGSVWTWGLAADPWWPEPPPQRVPNLTAVALATSGWGSCAINENQRVACWGVNVVGQTGQDPSDIPQRSAKEVMNLGPAAEVGTYPGRACARLVDGTVWCWGGEPLGNGEPGSSATPVRVLGIEGAVSLAVGTQHSCAIDGEARVFCWGGNSGGQLGIPPFNDDVWEPVRIFEVPRAARVAAGYAHVCVITEANEVYCWGLNTSAELGQGTSSGTSHIPLRVDIPLAQP